jgi:manganese transport protein
MIVRAPKPARGRWPLGPGLLVTAAFIGPGTVTTATQAGARFGFALLWTLLFAVVATITLQEMAARVGLVARIGLAEAIGGSIRSTWARFMALALVLAAIVVGNTAYQTGNLMGAGIGIRELTGLPVEIGAVLVGIVVAMMFIAGSTHRTLYRVLVGIVVALSVAFLATAFMTQPSPTEIARGVVTVSLPEGSAIIAIALVGTTVVPYNLFLHATAVQHRWHAAGDLHETVWASRIDTVVAVGIGGVVTMAIVVSAAATLHAHGAALGNVSEMSGRLTPLAGPMGSAFFAVGLAAAGVTSAVTAPLAAGYTVAGVFPNAPQQIVKLTAIGVVLIGTILAAAFGKSPHATIVLAQAANGVLLPLVAIFLLLVMNHRDMLGNYRNGTFLNLLGGAVVLLTCGLGAKSVVTLLWPT